MLPGPLRLAFRPAIVTMGARTWRQMAPSRYGKAVPAVLLSMGCARCACQKTVRKGVRLSHDS